LDTAGGVAGDPVRAYNYNGSSYGVASSTTGYSSGTWIHILGVFTSTTLRAVFLDGSSKGTDTTSIVGAVSELVLCRRRRNAAIGSMPSGSYIAEVAVWSSALSDANAASLAAGVNPQDIDFANLQAYWPLTTVTTNTDVIGSNNLTESTTLTYSATHPTISAPAGGIVQREPTFSGVGSLDVTPTITQRREPTFSGTGGLIVTPGISNVNNLGRLMDAILTPRQPGWDTNTMGGSADNWNEPKPKIIAPFPASGNIKAGTPAAARAQKFPGYRQSDVQNLWFETAHLLPRVVQELENVISDQAIVCELYNSHREGQITVSSITNNLGIGIEVTGVPATPFNIDPQRGLVFTLTVKSTGDLTIDASYTLHLSTGEDYTIYITGSRIVLFPIRPEAPLREHLLFDTKIIEHVDSTEQRIANRKYPRGMFEATYKNRQQLIEMLLFDRQAKIVAFPAWHEPSFLTSTAAKDAVTVNVDTTAYANFYVGGYAVVMEDEHTFDAVKIQSKTATSLTFETGMSYNYTTKAEVMPLLTAYIEASSASLKLPYNHQYFNLRIHTDPEVNDIADASAWSTYNSEPFMDGPNLIEGGQLAEALRTKVVVIDNITGLRSQVTAWDHNKRQSKKGWKTNSRQELWELRQLLHFLKGRQVGFYIPTFWKDLTIVQDLAIGTSVMNIEHIGYTVNAQQRWPKQVIRVVFKDGSILYRTIQNSAVLSTTVEQLTVDKAWPATYTPDSIERIEFLERVRLDVDDITIIHYNGLGQSECVVPIKEATN
jgi:hypothetical protein